MEAERISPEKLVARLKDTLKRADALRVDVARLVSRMSEERHLLGRAQYVEEMKTFETTLVAPARSIVESFKKDKYFSREEVQNIITQLNAAIVRIRSFTGRGQERLTQGGSSAEILNIRDYERRSR